YASGTTYPRTGSIVNFSARAYNNRTGANISYYQCIWKDNGAALDTSHTNNSGICSLSWNTASFSVGSHNISVAIEEMQNDIYGYYLPLNSNNIEVFATESMREVNLTESLNISLISPSNNALSHRGENILLNATVFDSIEEISANMTWVLSNATFSETIASNNGSGYWNINISISPGSYILNATANKTNYGSGWDVVNTSIYGWAAVNVTTDGLPSRTREENVSVLCAVRDENTSAGIAQYPVVLNSTHTNETGTFETLLYSGTTNGTGSMTYVWNTTNAGLGVHNLTCTISHNSSLYYNASGASSKVSVDIYELSNISITNKTSHTIYRDDSYGSSPVYANITFNVTSYGIAIQNATVHISINSTSIAARAIGNCTTGTSGLCTLSWNAEDDIFPENYTLMAEAVTENYQNSSIITNHITVIGVVRPLLELSGEVTYNLTLPKGMLVQCMTSETYTTSSVPNYYVDAFYGQKSDDYHNSMNDVSQLSNVSGTGILSLNNSSTNITALGTYRVRLLVNEAAYDEFYVSVQNISENTTLSVYVSDGTTTNKIINGTNQAGKLSASFDNHTISHIDFEINTTGLSGATIINNISLLDVSLDSPIGLFKRTILGNETGTYYASRGGDMESAIISNVSSCPDDISCWRNGWYYSSNAYGSATSNVKKYSNSSMALNITELQPGQQAYIIYDYNLFADYSASKAVGFWLKRDSTLNASFLLEHSDSVCIQEFALDTTTSLASVSNWDYYQILINQSKCAWNQMNNLLFLFKNDGASNISTTIYLDQVELLSSLYSNDVGIANIQWVPHSAGTHTLMCNITGNASRYYEAYPNKTFSKITIFSGDSENEDTTEDAPTEDEGYSIGTNATSFSIEPLHIQKIVAAGNFRALANITLTSRHQYPLNISLSLTGDNPLMLYIPDRSTMIEPDDTKNITIYYNTTGMAPDASYNTTIAVWTDTTKERIDVNVSLELFEFTASLLSPNSSSPALNITAGDIIEIITNATLNYTQANATSGIVWRAEINGTKCSIYGNQTYNELLEQWSFNCTAPELAFNPLNNSLRVFALNSLDEVFGFENNIIQYIDTTPPWLMDTPINSIEPNETASFIINISDNVAVDNVWVNVKNTDTCVEYTTEHLPNISDKSWNLSFTNTSIEGDYDITIYANDTLGHTGTYKGYFDIYPTTNFSGNIPE
ncbi:MAG: hypothetical protein KAJ24_00695, partial [Candidatus Aenigmarchaeota archaeon]|nr:hypothetical protein [Candidatus Aenigmarchaeota archaeon]